MRPLSAEGSDFIARGNVIDLANGRHHRCDVPPLWSWRFTDTVVQPLISRIGANPESDCGFLRIPLGDNLFIDPEHGADRLHLPDRRAVIYFVIIVPSTKLQSDNRNWKENRA